MFGRQQNPTATRAYPTAQGHNYIGYNHTGHDYIGHNYIGHTYISHNYIAEGVSCVPSRGRLAPNPSGVA